MSNSNINTSKKVMKNLFKEHVTYTLPDYLQKDEYVTKEEAVKQSAETLEGDTMAAENYVNKYSMRDGDGKVYEPTPNHMFRNRIAPAFASIERKFGGENALDEDEIYELMKGFNGVIPQGSVLSALGNYFQVQSTSNCFFINEFHIFARLEHMLTMPPERQLVQQLLHIGSVTPQMKLHREIGEVPL